MKLDGYADVQIDDGSDFDTVETDDVLPVYDDDDDVVVVAAVAGAMTVAAVVDVDVVDVDDVLGMKNVVGLST